MDHIEEIELIELAAGRVDAQRREDVRGHVRQCRQCRERLDALRRTWEILGAWEVRPAEHLASIEVPFASGTEKRDLDRSVIRLGNAGIALRFAATVAITAMAGYVGGRWSLRQIPVAGGVELPRYLSVLGLDIGESLSTFVLQDDSLPAEGGRI